MYDKFIDIFEKRNTNILPLDGTIVDEETSLFKDEYDIAVSLERTDEGIIIHWKNCEDGAESTSPLSDYDDMLTDFMDSIMEAEEENGVERYVYRDNYIHKFPNGSFAAYTMNSDGDIDETPCSSMERAMKVIDDHLLNSEIEEE